MPAITMMGRTTALVYSSSLLRCSPATNGPVSSTCKAEECDATLHNTNGSSTGCACFHKHTCMCVPSHSVPRLHLASSCLNSSSRDQQTSLPFRRRHTHNAAPLPLVCGGESLAHCHPSQAPSDEALDPHTLPWALSSFHEVLVAHRLHGLTSHCFVLPRMTTPLLLSVSSAFH